MTYGMAEAENEVDLLVEEMIDLAGPGRGGSPPSSRADRNSLAPLLHWVRVRILRAIRTNPMPLVIRRDYYARLGEASRQLRRAIGILQGDMRRARDQRRRTNLGRLVTILNTVLTRIARAGQVRAPTTVDRINDTRVSLHRAIRTIGNALNRFRGEISRQVVR
jgi:hypothetical protein